MQGKPRVNLKILEDKGKLGVKPTGVARGRGNLIIVRLTLDAFLKRIKYIYIYIYYFNEKWA